MNAQPEQQSNLSTRRRRIAAVIIDHVVISFLMVSIIFLALGPNFMDENNEANLTATMLAVMIPGCLLYLSKDVMKGMSVGKWIMGIMVRDADNSNEVPSVGRLLVRNCFIIIWPVEFIVLAASQEKKRLGDKAARTIVVNNPNKTTKLPRILTLIGVGLAFFTFAFLFAVTAMKNSEAYKVAILNIEQSETIQAETGGIVGYGMMPSGSVSISNGHGQARLEIKVLGNKRDLNVRVYLTKVPHGEWQLIEMDQ